jgi:hypothetical protein
MKLNKDHWVGIGLSAPAVLGALASAITFLTQHVTSPTADAVCVSGLPPTITGLVSGAISIAGVLGGYILLMSKSARSTPGSSGSSGSSGSGSGSSSSDEPTLPDGKIPSKPPGPSLQRRRILPALSLPLILPLSLFFPTACSPAQWQNFVTSAEAFLQYVQTFLTSAQAVWQIILGILPAAEQPKANLAFQNALQTVTDTEALLQDALNSGTAISASDLATLMTNIKAAVASVMSIIQTWSTPGSTAALEKLLPATASSLSRLSLINVKLQAWQVK